MQKSTSVTLSSLFMHRICSVAQVKVYSSPQPDSQAYAISMTALPVHVSMVLAALWTTVGDYTCSCTDGYSGKECNQDINQCLDGEYAQQYCIPETNPLCLLHPCFHTGPCESGGTCINLQPFFSFNCPPGYSDSRCQYALLCDTILCPQKEFCIESLAGAHIRAFIDLSSSLLITGSTLPHSGLLSDITVEYVERLQVYT